MGKGRENALDDALNQTKQRNVEPHWGNVHRLSVDALPTGSLSLDIALGIGGIPRGQITEIFGPESSGKTTICLHVIAEAQQKGGTCAFVDMEHALTPGYATQVGVNVNNLLVAQPNTGEQALEITETLVRSGAVEVVVVDSVAALVPRVELEGAMGDENLGAQARLISQALRKLSSAISQSRTTLIFTNQLRQKIGVVFGNPETTTGGNALKFYTAVRLDVRKIQDIEVGNQIIGSRTRVRVVKNKMASPFRAAEFDILYHEGISKIGDLLDFATEQAIITKRGALYLFGDSCLGQGRESAKDFLRQNPNLSAKIDAQARQQFLPPARMPVLGE